MKILTTEAQNCRRGSDRWFTGEVWIDEILVPTPPSPLKALRVSFAPGARTAWHTHPRGQVLHVLSGLGRVQLQGSPSRVIRPGDTVWIEAGENHWHGADPGHTMVHLAMQSADEHGIDVQWGDLVLDRDYASAPGEAS